MRYIVGMDKREKEPGFPVWDRGPDLYDVFLNLRREFYSVDLKAPAAIVLESRDEGMKVLALISQKQFQILEPGGYGVPVEHPDGSVWMEVQVCGIAVRWPAVKYAKEDGGYVWT